MKDSLKNNIKIKLISLMSAIVLWMYVMIIIDPEETRTIENLHVNISNMNKVREEDLMIYPDNNNLTVDINITGDLSDIKSIRKEDISIFGNINNPIEGKNEVYLTASTPQGITYKFDERVVFVNLEKVIKMEKEISINIEGNNKSNIKNVVIENNSDNLITVVGPRTLIDKVYKVEGYLDIGESNESLTENVVLKPVDSSGNIVEGVSLEYDSVDVTVNILQEKTVPLKLKIFDSKLSYNLSNVSVNIKADKKVLDKINFIETDYVNLEEIANNEKITVRAKAPENVYLSQHEYDINTNDIPNLSKLTYSKDDLEIKNNNDNKSLNIPEKINVLVNYKDTKPIKNDIKLFVDLEKSKRIQFSSNKNLDEVFIYPNSIQ